MRFIDLHTHSTCSDGTSTPTDLVREATEANLGAISLTDHDTMAGVAEAINAGVKAGIEVISGVELSANHDGKAVHVLGYGLDRFNLNMQTMLADLQTIRKNRNKQILEKLAGLTINIDRDELIASSSGLVGRPHIARMLVEQKVVHNFDQAFKKYLGKDGLAYVETERYPATETFKIIKDAGGLAVLAHPTTFEKSLNRLNETIRYLHKHGLDGVEAIYPGHTRKICDSLFNLAEKLDMVVTGGSDFHGSVKQGIFIGGAPVMPPVPYDLFNKIKKRLPPNLQSTSPPAQGSAIP